nr:cobalamin B12-binding domain-containing protein [Thermoanaerobaculia bacterium]
MRVSFLKPPIGGILGLEMITFVEPLGLECVAGALEEAGHDCQIVDLRLTGLDRGLAQARAFQPQVVGLQCNFTTERFRMLRVARRVREELSEALIVVGGHDASRDPDWFARPGIDVVALGDGEEVMPRLVTALEQNQPLDRVPGLRLTTPSGPVDTGQPPARRNVDELPFPARHLIAEYASEYYINFRRPLALLETARG